MAILRWLSLAGILAYIVDGYAMHISRPWIDNLGNPLWLNIIWNGLAVFGVELALVLYRGYKAVTLSNAEKADKDRHYN
jgi:D-alanyl-lipoteichoic acid acyltransferase DltB (MBOAT superfamily)